MRLSALGPTTAIFFMLFASGRVLLFVLQQHDRLLRHLQCMCLCGLRFPDSVAGVCAYFTIDRRIKHAEAVTDGE